VDFECNMRMNVFGNMITRRDNRDCHYFSREILPGCRGAHGIIMVYDVSNMSSFEHVEEWLLEVNRHASANTVKLLIGNKADLVNQKTVTEDVAQVFLQFIQCETPQ
jgi:GTPase SAR1 family protein